MVKNEALKNVMGQLDLYSHSKSQSGHSSLMRKMEPSYAISQLLDRDSRYANEDEEDLAMLTSLRAHDKPRILRSYEMPEISVMYRWS